MGLGDALLGAIVGGACMGPIGAIAFGVAGAVAGDDGLGRMADALRDEAYNND